MKRAMVLLALLSGACASAELGSAQNDPANPSATVAALDVGAGVLSSGFSPDALAPGPADDPHAGHDMSDPHAGHQHAPPPDTATDSHVGHDAPLPTASATVSSRPKAAPKKPAPPQAATTYTCMHHPEVVSTTKGQCPKCGMDLVPKKPAGQGQP